MRLHAQGQLLWAGPSLGNWYLNLLYTKDNCNGVKGFIYLHKERADRVHGELIDT